MQVELQEKNDRHGRNSLLASYIHYQAHLPHPDFRGAGQQQQSRRPSSAVDDEVGSIMIKGGAPGGGGAGFRNGKTWTDACSAHRAFVPAPKRRRVCVCVAQFEKA